MKITKEIIDAIDRAKDKVKKAEAKLIPAEFHKDSAWLETVNDIVDNTSLAVRNELEKL